MFLSLTENISMPSTDNFRVNSNVFLFLFRDTFSNNYYTDRQTNFNRKRESNYKRTLDIEG